MGLTLRWNLFRDVDAPDVFGALSTFYGRRGAELVEAPGVLDEAYELHRREGRWCLLRWGAGWEWRVRREAQLAVSRQLRATGLLVFAFDGDYWGYELFEAGEVVDRFVQRAEDASRWFGDAPCVGDAAALARAVGRSEDEVAPYLVPQPVPLRGPEWRALDVEARPGDSRTRFHECAVLDFARALGLDVSLREHRVEVAAERWRSFDVRW